MPERRVRQKERIERRTRVNRRIQLKRRQEFQEALIRALSDAARRLVRQHWPMNA